MKQMSIEETSDRIFISMSKSGFEDYKEAERAVLMLYVTDMSYHRGGICDALKRLEKHYNERTEGIHKQPEGRNEDSLC